MTYYKKTLSPLEALQFHDTASAWLSKARYVAQLNQRVQYFLAQRMAGVNIQSWGCRVVRIDETQVHICLAMPAALSRLKQLEPSLLAEIQTFMPRIERLQFAVKAKISLPETKPQPKQAKFSSQAAQHLDTLYHRLPEGGLRDSIGHMLHHAKQAGKA